MPFYDVTNIFVNSKFPKAGKSLVIYRFSIINISKSIRRTASKPISFESQDLFNANDKSSDNDIYRFVLQKTSVFLGILVIFTIFLKLEICQITIFDISKSIASINSKPTSFE